MRLIWCSYASDAYSLVEDRYTHKIKIKLHTQLKNKVT